MVAHTIPAASSTSSARVPSVARRDSFKAYTLPEPAFSSSRMLIPGRGGPPGDDFYAPLLLTGPSGSESRDLTAYTVDAALETGVASIWFRRYPSEAGVLRITPVSGGDADVYVDVWDGDDPAALEQRLDPVTGSPEGISSFTVVVPDIDLTAASRIRFASDVAGSAAGFIWTFVPAMEPLILTLIDDVISASPGVLRASVLGADAGELVRFQVVGSAAFTDVPAGPSGGITAEAIQVASGLSAGTHILRATGLGSGRVGEDVFTVLAVPSRPTPPAADAAPTPVTQSGVRHFVFQDPMTGGLGEYVFPVNPETASDPFPERYVTPEHTTSFAGGWLLWEGAERATSWSFSGRLATQAHYEAFMAWRTCLRRIHIHDQHNRAFLSRIKKIELTPDRKPGEPYAHRYEVRVDVYGWVQL